MGNSWKPLAFVWSFPYSLQVSQCVSFMFMRPLTTMEGGGVGVSFTDLDQGDAPHCAVLLDWTGRGRGHMYWKWCHWVHVQTCTALPDLLYSSIHWWCHHAHQTINGKFHWVWWYRSRTFWRCGGTGRGLMSGGDSPWFWFAVSTFRPDSHNIIMSVTSPHGKFHWVGGVADLEPSRDGGVISDVDSPWFQFQWHHSIPWMEVSILGKTL